MIEPKLPANENKRLSNLKSYSILDTLSDKDYDNLTQIAAGICQTPISLISLVDDRRQWFKSHHGLAATETPKEHAFCAHAINTPNNIFIIQDARIDERFHDNPLVTGDPYVIFYAGVPLVSDEGYPLGTLCVIDHTPKLLSKSQIKSLKALSNQVMNLLRLRKKKLLLQDTLVKLEEKNSELQQFASVAAHDLKSPLIGISNLLNLFSEKYTSAIDDKGKNMLATVSKSSDKLRSMVDGLLAYSRCENVLVDEKAIINLQNLTKDLLGLFTFDNNVSIMLTTNLNEVLANKTVLEQILINLISNAIKYSDKNTVKIELGVKEKEFNYEFYVLDNGPGIAKENQSRIFQIFEVLDSNDKYGNVGNGIGLATVKKMVEKSGGTIKVESKLGQGAKFRFTLKK